MSRHLSELLDDLKDRVARMGAMVQQVVEQAVEAVLSADAKLAQRTIDGDVKIDEEDVRVERAAIDLLALHQPAAGDLRLVTTVIKVNGELERIADCAVNAAQRVPPLSGPGRPFEEYYTQTPTHLWVYDLDKDSLTKIATRDRLAVFYTPALLLGDERILVQVVRHKAGQIFSMRSSRSKNNIRPEAVYQQRYR